MAFYSNQVIPANNSNQDSKLVDLVDDLNKIELEYLLTMLKNADLKGYEIEMFYNLVLKLQNQYIKK